MSRITTRFYPPNGKPRPKTFTISGDEARIFQSMEALAESFRDMLIQIKQHGISKSSQDGTPILIVGLHPEIMDLYTQRFLIYDNEKMRLTEDKEVP